MNFPNREELSFLIVLALPNDSNIGLDCKTCCSILFCCCLALVPLIVLWVALLLAFFTVIDAASRSDKEAK